MVKLLDVLSRVPSNINLTEKDIHYLDKENLVSQNLQLKEKKRIKLKYYLNF